MTVDQIRYFLEIAKCRSLLDASKKPAYYTADFKQADVKY
mgnify:CR=1 FL=1